MEQQQKSPTVLIPPPDSPNDDDVRALDILHRLGNVLATQKVRTFMDQCIDKGDDSVRLIQTGRYEMFASNAADKGSACFDEILQSHDFDDDAKDILLEYAKRRAGKDDRLKGIKCKFGNFSIISTYDVVDAQAPHIDLLKPNYQFGCIVSENSPGTIAYEVNDTIQSVNDLESVWNRLSGKEIPENLVRAFEQSRNVKELLQDYGSVLVPEDQMKEWKIGSPLQQGSVLSTPGSVVHAGPASSSYRAVLFFSACPDQDDVAEYDPDTQLTGIFLCGRLVTLLWRMPSMGFEERKYLLDMLVWYMQQSPVKRPWSHHFDEGNFCKFMRKVESGSLSEDALTKLIKTKAKKDNLCFFDIEGDFEVVCAKELFTTLKGKQYAIVVHRRRADGKVLIEYPNDSWEGSKPKDNYCLEMYEKDAKFDGANGKVTDTDGDEIKCYSTASAKQGRPTKRTRKK